MDDREFIPDRRNVGLFIPNPVFTGNPYMLFEPYAIRLLRRYKGERGALEGKQAYVCCVPSGQLYLSMVPNGPVFDTEAVEGTDFERIKL